MNDVELKLQSRPNFARLLNGIAAKNPLQKKRLAGFLAGQSDTYWSFAEDLSLKLSRDLLSTDSELAEGVDAYNKMCLDFLREQIQFKKCGQYRVASAAAATESVYSNVEVMKYYMKGLLLSYMFWPNHFRILEFFKEGIRKINFENYLEVGIGHGLFTVELLKSNATVQPHVVDISATSIAAAKDLLRTFDVDPSRIEFMNGDFLKVPLKIEGYDLIVMGEVIEHVDDAPAFMRTTYKALKKGGVVFLTTCANCPAIDHVYHFHNVGEIRRLIENAGFRIMSDAAWPSENVPEERWEEELITVNYAGFFQKI